MDRSYSYAMTMNSNAPSYLMSDKEQQDEIARQVQQQIREILKNKQVESKISHQLNVSFGMLPGLSAEQMALINQNIENEQLSQIVERGNSPKDMVFMYSEPLVIKEK